MTDTQYYSLLTNSGHQANIKAKALGLPIVLSKVAFGSGNITPTESATGLVKEEIRVNINSIIQNETDQSILEIEAVIPSDIGGFTINEAALYLEDGTLYAIMNLPASYKSSIDQGAGKEFTFRIFLASAGVENVILKIDDSIVYATRKYVQNELKKYAFINGDETNTFKVADAVLNNEAINKKQMDESLKISSLGSKATPVDTDVLKIQETGGLFKKLSWANLRSTLFNGALSLTPNGYIKLPTVMGGYVMQWGSVSTDANGVATITLPTAFEWFNHKQFATVANSSFTTVSWAVAIGPDSTITKTSFQLVLNTAGVAKVNWFAVGN